MMKTKIFTAGALLAAIIVTAAARPAFAQDREATEKGESQAQPWPPTKPITKISPLQAMAAARVKLGGGTAFSANFEFDEGHWVYGVMVVKGHVLSEVQVNPMTGKVLASESVTPAVEAKETQDELTKIVASGG